MANDEQLAILRQGRDAWNVWRENSPNTRNDLSCAALGEAKLRGADLRRADLSCAALSGANLSGADLSRIGFITAASEADLSGAKLIRTTFITGKFGEANLSRADLSGAAFWKSILSDTIFSDVDLSQATGLDSCIHTGPSIIDFLRACPGRS